MLYTVSFRLFGGVRERKPCICRCACSMEERRYRAADFWIRVII